MSDGDALKMAQFRGQYGAVDIFFDHPNEFRDPFSKNSPNVVTVPEEYAKEFEVENVDDDGIWKNANVKICEESLNEIEGSESDGCEEKASKPSKVAKFIPEIDGENPQF
ncbi:hypothetical protein M9H77_08277 [Catharanthus roseus]|uniref:Uncharacterized protein n=1 Tax=Catharanthus roseus TaxID=4058 RepID=A0ACC0BXJ1_CATRO|nr:hypothetical protein M9H77_08277 [Catharanthus roseus]